VLSLCFSVVPFFSRGRVTVSLMVRPHHPLDVAPISLYHAGDCFGYPLKTCCRIRRLVPSHGFATKTDKRDVIVLAPPQRVMLDGRDNTFAKRTRVEVTAADRIVNAFHVQESVLHAHRIGHAIAEDQDTVTRIEIELAGSINL